MRFKAFDLDVASERCALRTSLTFQTGHIPDTFPHNNPHPVGTEQLIPARQPWEHTHKNQKSSVGPTQNRLSYLLLRQPRLQVQINLWNTPIPRTYQNLVPRHGLQGKDRVSAQITNPDTGHISPIYLPRSEQTS